jgi:predicted MFS family arabinose efflux permease
VRDPGHVTELAQSEEGSAPLIDPVPAPAPAPWPGRRRKLSGIAAVVLVALTAAVAQSFGRFTFGVLLPAIRDDLNLSNSLAGTLATVNVGAYLLGTLVVAAAASRYRLLVVMRGGMGLAVAGLSLAALAPGPWVLGVGLFLTGLGGACTWIPAPVVAADALAPEKRSFAIGLLAAGMGLGVVFTGQLASFVRSTAGDASWRTVYTVQAIIGVVVVVTAWLLIGHRQDRPSSKGGIGGFSALRRMHGWIPYTCAFTAFGLMYLLVIAFLTTRLEDDSGWTSSRASLAFTLLGVAMIFGGPFFIGLAERITTRRALSVAFTSWVVCASMILPGWLVPTLIASVALGLLFSGLPTMFTVYVVANTTADDYGPSFAAATLAFGVAQMMSPQVGGSIADAAGSFTPVFVLSAALAVVGLIAALQLPRQGPDASAPTADWRKVNMTFHIAPD